MADNVPVTPGTGTTIAADEVTRNAVSEKQQIVKISLGADGAFDNLIDSGQQAMASSVPVTLASDQTDVKVTLDSEAVVLGAGSAAVGKLAANDGVDIGDVTVNNAVGAGVYIRPGSGVNLDTSAVVVSSSGLPTGAATSAKQDTGNTSLATIDTSNTAIQTAVETLDDVVATDGSAALTKLFQVGGTDGTNAQIISTNSSGHVNIADGGNVLSIDDAGGSLTIDGTVASTQSGTWNVGTVTTITDVVAVNDNGSSLTVDNGGTFAVQAAQSGAWNITNISGTVTLPTLAATSTKQSDGSQKTQIVDGAGNVIGSTSNALDVNIASGSSSGTQYTEADTDASITGTAVLWEDTSDTLRAVSAAKPLPVDIKNTAIAASQSGAWEITTYPQQYNGVTFESLVGNGANGLDVDVTRVQGTVAVTQSGTWDEVGINDSGNSITVDNNGTFVTQATLQTGNNVVGQVKLSDGTDVADVLDLTNANPLTVAIVDGTGDQITSFGGGTQYTEGDIDASITGTAMLWEDGSDTLRAVSAAKPLPIGDAGGSLTVDGTVAVTNAGLTELAAAINGSSQMDVNIAASTTLTVASHAVTNAGTFPVQIDGSALTSLQLADDVVATLGTTTYTEASTKGTVIGAVRRDADTTLVDTTNEFGPLQMDANGRLKVEAFSGETLPVSLAGTVAVTQSGTWDEIGINDSGNSITVDNGGTFAVQVDGAALTSLQLLDDSVATTASAITTKGIAAVGTDGTNARILKTDTSGELQIDVLTLPALAAGTNGIGKLTANTGVTIGAVEIAAAQTLATVTTLTGTTTLTPGTSAANLGKAEDAIHGSGDTGVMALAVSNEANTQFAADADYVPLGTNREGSLRIIGSRASDAVDADAPVKMGFRATTSNQGRVATDDRVNGIADTAGRQIVNLGQVRDLRGKQTTTISASTTETTIVTAAASTFNDLIALVVSNTSAATNTRIDFRDTTAGTILFSLQAPANQTTGFVLTGSSIPQTSLNTNWTAQCGTSTTDIRVLAIFEKNI